MSNESPLRPTAVTKGGSSNADKSGRNRDENQELSASSLQTFEKMNTFMFDDDLSEVIN
jgi:hypothetical protein